MMIDSLEHIPKADGRALLERAQALLDRVIVMTPDGLVPQDSDSFGLGGEHWQKHRAGWTAADLEGYGFRVRTVGNYHVQFGQPYGALFARWDRA